MDRIGFLSQIADSLYPAEFRIVRDQVENEYVVFRDSGLADVLDFEINDKTLLEAMENHIHFFNRVSKKEIPFLKKIAECVCSLTLGKLEADFPEKKFVVYIAIQKNESVIFRFHQLWPGELPYYGDDEGVIEDRDLIIVTARSK